MSKNDQGVFCTEAVDAKSLFDQAVTAVVKQGRPSLDHDGSCAYRGALGLKCAAGHLIRDDEYIAAMEGCSYGAYDGDKIIWPHRLAPHASLILWLQDAHD